MLIAIFGPFVLVGVVAAILATIATLVVIAFFMLESRAFAAGILVTGGIVLMIVKAVGG